VCPGPEDDHLTRPQSYNIYLDAELQQMGSNETFTNESMKHIVERTVDGDGDASKGVFLVKSSMTVEGEHLRSTAVDL